MPARLFYPGGNDGNGWVAVTVRVPSGERVAITDLFKDPQRALPVLVRLWKATFRREDRRFWRFCVAPSPSFFRPTVRNLPYFALAPHGLAVGYWQAPACNRLEAVVPYASLRPYLSKLGETLVAGVRSSR